MITRYHSRTPPTWECHRRGCTETNHHISPLTKATSEVLHHQPPASAAQSHHRSWRGKRPQHQWLYPQPNLNSWNDVRGFLKNHWKGGSLKNTNQQEAKTSQPMSIIWVCSSQAPAEKLIFSWSKWNTFFGYWKGEVGEWQGAPKSLNVGPLEHVGLVIAGTRPHAQIMKWPRKCFLNRHKQSFLLLWEQVNLLQSAPNNWEPNAPKTTHNWVRQKNACSTHRSQVKRIPGPTFQACFT